MKYFEFGTENPELMVMFHGAISAMLSWVMIMFVKE